eukprot:1150268-Alexandrium_andersonii.AAC.1
MLQDHVPIAALLEHTLQYEMTTPRYERRIADLTPHECKQACRKHASRCAAHQPAHLEVGGVAYLACRGCQQLGRGTA